MGVDIVSGWANKAAGTECALDTNDEHGTDEDDQNSKKCNFA